MVKSIFDPYREVSKEKYLVSLIQLNDKRDNNRKGALGFFVVEKIDQDGNYRAYLTSSSFGTHKDYRTLMLSVDDARGIAANRDGTHSEVLSKEQFEKLGLNDVLSLPAPDSKENDQFSYQKAKSLLEKKSGHRWDLDHEKFGPAVDVSPNTSLQKKYPFSWNPFAQLIESKHFPAARLRRSPLGKRIGDAFYVLKGKSGPGVLDYIIPTTLIGSLLNVIPIVGGLINGLWSSPKFAVNSHLFSPSS